MKSKVVHIGYSHSIYDTRIYLKECRTLKQNDYDVSFITSEKCSDKRQYEDADIELKVLSLEEIGRVRKLKRYYKSLTQEILRRNIDICHVHEFLLLPICSDLQKKGIKIIYDLHEDTPRQMLPLVYHKFGSLIGKVVVTMIEKYENRWIKKADGVIAATSHIYERVRVRNSKSQVIKNYPILNECIVDEQNKENAICFAGTIAKENGLIEVIDAINRTDTILYLAGEMSGPIQKYIMDHNERGNIHYLGYLSRQEIYHLYAKCLAGIVTDLPTPNNKEALPIKMFEFMAARLCFITSNYPIRKEIVDQYHCGFLVNPDSNSIYELIQRLNEIKGELNIMGSNGYRAVQQEYNWSEESRKLIELYSEVGK